MSRAEWLSEDSGCKQQLQPSTINLLFRCLWFWSFVKSYKNICVNNSKTKSVKYLPINDTSKTGRQVLITGPWRREREIFLTEPKEIFTMSQWALSRHKFRPGPHYPGPPDNTSELTLLATIIFLSFTPRKVFWPVNFDSCQMVSCVDLHKLRWIHF